MTDYGKLARESRYLLRSVGGRELGPEESIVVMSELLRRVAEEAQKPIRAEERYWRHEVVTTRLCPVDHKQPHISHDCITKIEERWQQAESDLTASREQEQRWYESFHREMCRAEDAESALVQARDQVRRLREALEQTAESYRLSLVNRGWPVESNEVVILARAALAETAQEEEK